MEVTCDDATSDLYQLPLATLPESEAAILRETSPQAIIAKLDETPQPTVLVDASALTTFQSALLRMILVESDIQPASVSSGLIAVRSNTLDPNVLTGVASHLGSAEQSNTSILYNQTAILKLFRRVRPGENPEVEIGRHLTDVAHFANTPAYLGDLQRGSDGTTLAFLQAFAPNEGNGWTWTLDELGRFYEEIANCPPPSTSVSKSANTDLPCKEVVEHAGLYLEQAQLLGRRTAEMHLALATPTADPAFCCETYRDEDLVVSVFTGRRRRRWMRYRPQPHNFQLMPLRSPQRCCLGGTPSSPLSRRSAARPGILAHASAFTATITLDNCSVRRTTS